MVIVLCVLHLLLGFAAAHVATRRANHRVFLEYLGGAALLIGLAAVGVGLAQY